MTRLLDTFTKRSTSPLSLQDWISFFNFQGLDYPVLNQTLAGGRTEEIGTNFEGFVHGAYRANGVVFACMLARQLLFSEARFKFRRQREGRPGELFGTRALRLLEEPWPGGTTGELLSRAIQDVDLSGNFFGVREANRIWRARPDWMTIVMGSNMELSEQAHFALDAEVVGYLYHPGGLGNGRPLPLLPEQVAHWAPIPDPIARYRGMSWLLPIINEIQGDQAASTHKQRYFDGGATPNLVVQMDPAISEEDVRAWIQVFKEEHEGAENAYKTMFLGGGASATAVGSNLRENNFKDVVGAGETRIAAAAGVPPVIVGLSEGLAAATYSNYSQARRRFADGTMRPLWRSAAASLAAIVDNPSGSELWYDDRDIPFLQEDAKDDAEIQQIQATTIKALVESGYEHQSVIDAVTSGDYKRLRHSGLFSVQLQPAGTNGNGATVTTPDEE